MRMLQNSICKNFMSCVQKVFGWSFVGLCISQAVLAVELFKFDRNVAGFVNYNSPQSILFISPDGKGDWMNDTVITKSVSYAITNPDCIPLTQSTMIMDENQAGMTLAYPFLVGVGRVCKIDEQTNSIHLVSQFPIPENAYSVVYAGEDENTSYLLMNSKPWKGDGFLHLISIQKSTLQVSTRIFATNVPGYSGAMLFDKNNVFVTTWPGKIYKIPHEKLMGLVKGNTQENFLQIAQLVFNAMDGMNFFMLSNENSFLYYNVYDDEQYDIYTVNLENKTQRTIPELCPPVAGYQTGWLVLCNSTSLQVATNH